MKITKATIFFPRKGAAKTVGVRIYTDEGIYGDGEVAGINACQATYGTLMDLLPLIIGRNPLDTEAIWDDLYKKTFYGQNGGQAFFSGLGAIDIALWDIKGKYFNVPLYVLLGGKKRDKLRTYASQLQIAWDFDPSDAKPSNEGGNPNSGFNKMFANTPEQFAANAKYCVDLGYDCVKIDFFNNDRNGNPLTELDRNGLLRPSTLAMVEERVAAVREAIGPDVDLIVENHCYTDAQAAIQLANTIEKYNIYFFEEPCTPSPRMSKYVKDNIRIPVANGERIISRWEYANYFQENSIQVIQPDMGNNGGITEVKKICDMAYIYDVGVQLHTCGSHLMTPASLHLEAVLPNFLIHEHHVISQWSDYIIFTDRTYNPVNGYFEIPELPGVGIEWSEFTLNCEQQTTIK